MATYSNTYYDIEINDTSDGYLIINKETHVVEAECQHLPGAILTADNYCEFFDKRTGKGAPNNDGTVIPIR